MRGRGVVIMAVVAAGCGGGLKYKVDDVALASVPVEEKQTIFGAQNAAVVARSEQQRAEQNARATDNDIAVARGERAQARIEVDKAKLEQKAAEKAGDRGRLEGAAAARAVADLGDKAADARVDWLDALKRWHQRFADMQEAAATLATAGGELQKARIAEARQIRPTPSFRVSNFIAQYAQKEEDFAHAKRKAEDARAEHDRKEQVYGELRNQYAQRRGQPTGDVGAPIAAPGTPQQQPQPPAPSAPPPPPSVSPPPPPPPSATPR